MIFHLHVFILLLVLLTVFLTIAVFLTVRVVVLKFQFSLPLSLDGIDFLHFFAFIEFFDKFVILLLLKFFELVFVRVYLLRGEVVTDTANSVGLYLALEMSLLRLA